MQTIFEYADYQAAQEQLTQLCEAHAAAVFEETALIASLDVPRPATQATALQRASALLSGAPMPTGRNDSHGLTMQLSAVREKLELLNAAIAEQRGMMAGLVQAQSAVVNAERKADHIKAAERIKTALAGLRDAMQAEQGLRAEIEAGGYQCTLDVMARPELNFADSQATITRFARDVDSYLMLNEIDAAKSVNVRLLFGTGDSLPGDVVTMTGHEAAALVRIGHAEQTRDKPGRVARPVRESYGLALG